MKTRGSRISLLDSREAKIKDFKLPYKEGAKKVKGSLPSRDISGKTRIPLSIIKTPPRKVGRKGYFSYSIQAITRSVKRLGGKIGRLWSHEKTEHFLITQYKDESRKIPLAKIVPGLEEEIKDSTISSALILKKFIEKIPMDYPRKTKFRWPLKSVKELRGEIGRREIIVKTRKGRAFGYEKAKEISDLAILPTIRTAIIRRSHLFRQGKIAVSTDDLMGYRYKFKAKVTIILILDTSTSMMPHIITLADTLSIIQKDIKMYRDRVCVIAVQGKKAKVIIHPTTNIYIVQRAVRELPIGGSSPLADGLLKGLQIIRHEKRRNSNIIALPIVITDGLANVPLYDNESYKEIDTGYPAQLDVLRIARLYRHEGVPIVVINPIENDEWISRGFISPTLLAKKIAEITNGSYYGYKTGFFRTTLTTNELTSVLREEIRKAKIRSAG